MVKRVVVKQKFTDEEMKKKEGQYFDESCCKKIYNENVDIYTEEGELLLKFRKNVLNADDCNKLFDSKGAAQTTIRPGASGIKKGSPKYIRVKSQSSGKILCIQSSKNRVKSGIMGFYDTISNFGYHHNKEINKTNVKCRLTAFTSRNMDKYKTCLPIFKKIDRIYKKLVPAHYKVQKSAINKVNKKFVIKDTIFTTVTVNKNFRTALHCDVGDLKEGFGNLTVVSRGEYTGACTLFPQYEVGVDCRNGDFLAMNVHKWHCNSKMKGDKDAERLSFVFYLREKMIKACPRSRSRSGKKTRSRSISKKRSL
jgi:hypothetical protein